jgi:fucose 4-O-acetylase-like acetyltransferase
MSIQISRFLSQKLRFYTFISIVLLLFVHGYNLKWTYLVPSSTVSEDLTFTTFFEYFLANGLLRFRIPLLFIISGFIYAMQDKKPYGEQVGKRAKTLLIPYFVWSAIGLAVTFLWQQFPATAQAVSEATLDQLGDNRPYTEIGWYGIIKRWLLTPISFQLWFILALFLYDLAYPFITWMLKKYAYWWFAATFLVWVFELSFFVVDGRGLFFFSLGIWLQKTNFNLEKKPEWLSLYIAWLLFIGFSVIKTFMAFELEPGIRYLPIGLNLLHQGSVLSGIIAVWYGADAVVKWCMRRQWFLWSASFSFFIFGLHVPLAGVCHKTDLHVFRRCSQLPFTYLFYRACTCFTNLYRIGRTYKKGTTRVLQVGNRWAGILVINMFMRLPV